MSLPLDIEIVEETGSTNADLAARVGSSERLREGYWLVARRQTAGKGRQGREWLDGSGNFMGSTVVALRDGDPPPASLSFVTALAVRAATAEFLPSDVEPALKWPNDVLVRHGKLSGILLEMVGDQVVVGVGVNLASAPRLAERKTSAIAEFGPTPDLEPFSHGLARHFAAFLDRWRTGGLKTLLGQFLAASVHSAGSNVRVHDTTGEAISGTFAGLDEADGALRLRLADGTERVIRAGDLI